MTTSTHSSNDVFNLPDAVFRDRAPFFKEGTYVLEVDRAQKDTSQKQIEYFAVDFKIIESSNPEFPPDSFGRVYIEFKQNFPIKPGETPEYQKRVYRMVSAIINAPVSKIQNIHCSALLLEDGNKAQGRKVRMVATTKVTKKGTKWCDYKFEPLSPPL